MEIDKGVSVSVIGEVNIRKEIRTNFLWGKPRSNWNHKRNAISLKRQIQVSVQLWRFKTDLLLIVAQSNLPKHFA